MNDKIEQAYARYDSDPRVHGIDDMDAFRDALTAMFGDNSEIDEAKAAETAKASTSWKCVCGCSNELHLRANGLIAFTSGMRKGVGVDLDVFRAEEIINALQTWRNERLAVEQQEQTA